VLDVDVAKITGDVERGAAAGAAGTLFPAGTAVERNGTLRARNEPAGRPVRSRCCNEEFLSDFPAGFHGCFSMA